MSRSITRLTISTSLVLLSVLFLPGVLAGAVPPAGPLLGITPTFTFTPSPTVPPISPTSTPKAEVGVVDPVITKRGEPENALPGEKVTFTLEITNRGQHAAVDVVVIDQVSSYLEILEVTTTQGTVTVEGQKVIAQIGIVGPDFVVEIVIHTRVRLDAPSPLDVENVATLKSPNSRDRTSSPVTIKILDTFLPLAGGRTILWVAPTLLASGLVALGIGLRRRKRTHR